MAFPPSDDKVHRVHNPPRDHTIRSLRCRLCSIDQELEAWETRRQEHVRRARYHTQCGTNAGVLCRLTPFLDLGMKDQDAVLAAEGLVRGRFEDDVDIVVRIGWPPKRAIPFRTDTPFDKIVVNLTAPNGDKQKIEFLGRRSTMCC
jgi:hypothetical protein